MAIDFDTQPEDRSIEGKLLTSLPVRPPYGPSTLGASESFTHHLYVSSEDGDALRTKMSSYMDPEEPSQRILIVCLRRSPPEEPTVRPISLMICVQEDPNVRLEFPTLALGGWDDGEPCTLPLGRDGLTSGLKDKCATYNPTSELAQFLASSETAVEYVTTRVLRTLPLERQVSHTTVDA